MMKFKRILVTLIAGFAAFILAACGNSSDQGSADAPSEEPVNMVLFLSALGDQSFGDSAHAGLAKIEEEFGDRINTDYIEVGYDFSASESYLLDAVEKYDILAMPSQYVEVVKEHAQDYPDVQFWIYGTQFPYFDEGDYSNVYAVHYMSNEASYLAGFLEASRTDGKLGLVGGVDNNVINDFRVGYEQGAKHAKDDATVNTVYVGDFSDVARAKDLTLALAADNVQSVFSVAGSASSGIAEGALETGMQMIGVDSDQEQMFRDAGRDDTADIVPTSVLTNVGDSLLIATQRYFDGSLELGKQDFMGLESGVVGLVTQGNFQDYYTEEQIQEAEQIKQDIIDGNIQVETVY